MEEKTNQEETTDHGVLEPEPEPLPFSIVLAPSATVGFQDGGAFIRHLRLHRDSNRSLQHGSPSPLPSVVIAVRAQPCALHLFVGRRLCRVVEFSSPIADVAGLPLPEDRSLGGGEVLCVAVCRDGTAYALPTAEVLEATGETAGQGVGGSAHRGPVTEEGSKRAVGNGSTARKDNIRTTSYSVGIFDDLAPTMLADSPPAASRQPQRRGNGRGGNNDTSLDGRPSSAGGAVGRGLSLGDIVLRAQDRWAIFSHVGARRVAASPTAGGSGGAAIAVAGIVDRAALYSLAGGSEGDGMKRPGRHLYALVGVDGAAPTTSCVVWMDDGGAGAGAEAFVCEGRGGDEKGFALDSRAFRALFGTELLHSTVTEDSTLNGKNGTKENSRRSVPAVVLIGDEAGTVRWSPVRPSSHPGVCGGVLAGLGAAAGAIRATLPQLDAETNKAIGVLVVGSNGAVLCLAPADDGFGAPRKVSRKRARPGTAGGGSSSALDDGRSAGETESPSLCRRAFRLPFPVASACSVPGFLVHCHAGALFASALPAATPRGVSEGQQGDGYPGGRSSFNRSHAVGDSCRPPTKPSGYLEGPSSCVVGSPASLLRPVRLPLPCDAVDVAAAHVLVEGDGGSTSHPPSSTTCTLIVSFSARGRLVGFMAPRSVEELEGWGLVAGKGGVRVGGSAGVERRVRGQLERLSNVGLQCAALSAESAGHDHEIRILRGAAGVIPELVASAVRRQGSGGRKNCGESSPGPVGHSVSIRPDIDENFDVDDVCDDGPGQHESLRVRLRVRMWALDGSHHAIELPAVGVDGAGRWFLVTQVVADGGGGGDEVGVGEGWSWSMSSLVPMPSLRQGWKWGCSAAVTLPSARPVTVTSWLQFRFGEEEGGGSGEDNGGLGEAGPATTAGWGRRSGRGEGAPESTAAGVCVELGTSRFDLLDWAVTLPSVPGNAAAVRGAARGRGSCFCGPELAMADIIERRASSSVMNGACSGGALGTEGLDARLVSLPAAWSSFRLLLASPDLDAGALLALLLRSPASPMGSAGKSRKAPGAPARGGSAPTELAVRVAGQVVVLRARDCAVAAGAAGAGRSGQVRAKGSGAVEIYSTCSHEAVAPLVREALLSRVARARRGSVGVHGGRGRGVACGDADGTVIARGDVAARLVREVHPIGRSIVDASDAARAIGLARVSDGASVETAKEALALMHRIGEIYQALRNQQEEGAGASPLL